MRLGFLMIGFAIVTLSSCITGEEAEKRRQEALDQRMANYNGQTVDQFMANNPQFRAIDGYNSKGGRVFKYEAVGGMMTILGAYGAPTISRQMSCIIEIRATQLSDNPTSPEDWEIKGIRHFGGCM